MNKRKLVLGFIFDSSLQKVLLIHKNRPDWQRGKLNGLGGKLNPKETKEKGITREVTEESSLVISKWFYVGTLQNADDIIYCFTVIHKGKTRDAKTTTDEKVEWFSVENLPGIIHPNLSWLIPLCTDILQNKKIRKINVDYKD